jgi:hypothetical protein
MNATLRKFPTQQTIDVDDYILDLSVYSDLPAGMALPDLSGENWRDTATESHDNEVLAIHSWKIGELWLHIYTDQGYPKSAEIGTQNHMEFLAEICDNIAGDVDQDRAEIMAGFAIDFPTFLTEAAADFAGECRVWHMPNYYSGHNNPPLPSFARDEDDLILTFGNRAAAEQYVSDYYSEPSCYDGIPACNVLSHGQAGADTLKIVEAE